ncbi:MAG: hypothetical protein VR64_17840 [Desulfatitalea sp. BRH_c12]|nr:MAG: hypothetical protein VR64_17840 [Desulfatitalea sp. BRH_c12]
MLSLHCTGRWIVRNMIRVATLTLLAGSTALPLVTQAAPPREAGPPPTVMVTRVTEEDVNPPKEYVGRVEAIQSVDLRARVEGFLEKVAFREGALVKAGDLLYVIEQAPYRARLAEARARVSQAEAAMTQARQYLQRLRNVKTGGVSALDLDAAISSEQQAAARFVEAKANLDQAQLNLEYTSIQAPISGRIGRTAYTRGNLVGPASVALARIVQIDPIRAVYSVSENEVVDAQMAPKSGRGGDKGDSLFVPRLKLPNGKMFPDPGRIDFIDNQVDPDTGTIAIRAVFDNPQGLLLPGQYVTVLLSRSASRRLPVIPQAAVVEDRNGRYVFVVDDQKTVRMRRIETGNAIRNHWVVENGLTAGETIIVQGIQKVTPDQKVNVQTAEETPKE